MAGSSFGWNGFLIRWVVAIILVFSTWNPSGHSWGNWVVESFQNNDYQNPLLWLSAVILIIGWAIYLRATARSLGVWGLLLVGALFATMLWMMIYYGLLSLDNKSIMSYVALSLLSLLLAIGISWSHLRRRITGQVDVDDVEQDV